MLNALRTFVMVLCLAWVSVFAPAARATSLPVISNLQISGITSTSAVFTWTTDYPTSSQVFYGTSSAYDYHSPLNTNFTASHQVVISNLTPGTVYYAAVRSYDSTWTYGSDSPKQTFVTLSSSPAPSPTPSPTPVATMVISNLQLAQVSSTSVQVSWTTNVLASSQVFYGLSTAYDQHTPLVTVFSTSHQVTVSNLVTGSSYLLAVRSYDSTWSFSADSSPLRFTAGGAVTKPVLLFVGLGTSSSEVASLETILGSNSISYVTADSTQMNAMSESQLAQYGMLLVPGGNSIDEGNGLSNSALAAINAAVTKDGLSYMGICAGAFLAGTDLAYRTLNLAPSSFYFYTLHFQGIIEASVLISFPDGSSRKMIWWDGPQLSAWGNVIARYPTGDAAAVQHMSGNGFVTLIGVHPDAPTSWRDGEGIYDTNITADYAYMAQLIHSALNRVPLPTF